MTATKLTGCGTALVTPFADDGSLDERALRDLVEWQVAEGIHFLVPCGSTGEAATMTVEEQVRTVRVVVEQVKGRLPVVAGATSNDTQKAIELSRAMEAAGATHLLHASPMYNKPPQRGIVAHLQAIASATTIPIVVYNVPGRTAGNIEAATTLALAANPRMCAVKEASGNLHQITDILAARPTGFSVLSGDDEMTLAVLAAGGDGIVSVISNATPRLMAQLADRALAGDLSGARALHYQLLPWMRAAFVESNPLPVKAALAMMGRIRNNLRLPLVPMDPRHESALRSALQRAGALK
ncbi:MAG TPA: 4-hydroxy-tetrahydrodipicolinate synthase [Gemmatimonadaceae bacterium]|jgi:4-hydroxy-tetrahydrodipicolinate synthase|nr:4-hydroxy-tetrahydrodipicolinate synthase [Gemmatimonadaceae bacterium]